MVYMYFMDVFIPLHLSPDTFLSLGDSDPNKLFEYVRNIVERETGPVNKVKLIDRFIDTESISIVIEYVAVVKMGKIEVKLIYSDNPGKTLMKYQEYKRLTRRRL